MIERNAFLTTLLLALLASRPAGAAPVENLATFTAGTPARASEVNENFTEVANSLNDTDQRVVELEALVAGLQAQLADLRGQISNLTGINDFVSLQTVNGQPTIRFTAANVQIVNGLDATTTTNGTGNLLIGYDEERTVGDEQCSIETDPNTQLTVSSEAECLTADGLWALSHKSGSHYLIVGGRHNYSRWSGIVVGDTNTSNFDLASVSGGANNTASGLAASVSGGSNGTASGSASSVSGGQSNAARGHLSSVSGGLANVATGGGSSISGGQSNLASGGDSTVSGGSSNTASGFASTVSGGNMNTASGVNSSVGGGLGCTASTENDWAAGNPC